MPYEFSILPAISEQSILHEAKKILMENAGVTDPDTIQQILADNQIFEQSCPNLAEIITKKTDDQKPMHKYMTEMVEQWRHGLAKEALADVDESERQNAVVDLEKRFSNSGHVDMNTKMAQVMAAALQLAGSDEAPLRVHIIPGSALSLFEDLESATGIPTPHTVGDPDNVPTAMSLDEIIEHCAMVDNATEPEKAWIIRKTAEYVLETLNENLYEDSNPSHSLIRETYRHDVKHPQAVDMLRELMLRHQDQPSL